MPSCFHLLVRVTGGDVASNTISKQFANLFSTYTQVFNKKYNRKGSFFQKSFKRKEMATDAYLWEALAKIYLNPIRHDFVTHSSDGEWTLFQHCLHKGTTFIHRQPVWQWFGSKESYLSFHKLYVGNWLTKRLPQHFRNDKTHTLLRQSCLPENSQ
jgi:hypothetical protein